MKNIVIIAPHCDDEYLGCSSVLKQGNVKKIIVATEKLTKSGEPLDPRKLETIMCAQKFGVSDVQFLCLEDGKLIRELNYLHNLLYGHLSLLPNDTIVYLPSLWERHLDHKAVAFAGLSACQQLRLKSIMYSVWGLIPVADKSLVRVNWKAKLREFQELYSSQRTAIPDLIDVIKQHEEFLDCSNKNLTAVRITEKLQ